VRSEGQPNHSAPSRGKAESEQPTRTHLRRRSGRMSGVRGSALLIRPGSEDAAMMSRRPTETWEL